ncbi:Crp/Fnr family transcriptional regulator [Chryseolinea sp. Jin1]|uniref:Crp/Fnr family transcriptional regulator n=1 Tax=Chryseolinea lacunae TaxID=2801331 RepID=A0ABS1KKR5_9BACT|nr:Crp/Fnr family transcriptional regulator [Chryseolinea lacunae]
MANPLISYFDALVPLTADEQDDLAVRVAEQVLKRKEFVLQAGTVCHHYTFVVEGCLKMYSIDNAGKEHNLQFAAENDWMADISSFYSDKPSKLFIETLEPSRILIITKDDLLFLYKQYPKFVRYFKVIFENKFVEMQNRVLQNISSTAEERYLTFLEQYPNLSNRIPSTQIASYLGITPEFLSKVRKDLAGK